VAVGTTAPLAGHNDGSVAAHRSHHTWVTDVNLRVSNADPYTCGRRPSIATCPDVRRQL
jgi:hypothetical protein